MKEQSFAFENALLDYLGSEQIQRVSNEALARFASQYRLDRVGYGQQIIDLIVEEQERRRQLAADRAEATANKTLSVSRWGMWAAVAAALAAIAVLFK